MTHLTPKTVRARAGALTLLIALTFAVVILGFVYFSSNGWFWVLAAFIDIPMWIVIAVLERSQRSTS